MHRIIQIFSSKFFSQIKFRPFNVLFGCLENFRIFQKRNDDLEYFKNSLRSLIETHKEAVEKIKNGDIPSEVGFNNLFLIFKFSKLPEF